MRHLLILFFAAFVSQINAQEFIAPLKYNAVLQHNDETPTFERKRTVELPFLDDFYPNSIFPNPVLWEDDLVYINATFPVNPPTIGVATFDGLNAKGEPYSLLPKAYGIADELTSMPINLDGFTNASDVFLSFFFQPKGLGERPDFDPSDQQNQDFFLVEFLDTASNWDTLWITQGDTLKPFEQVFVKVEEAYLHDAFQMRFRAIGRLTGALDHWHLDYVKIDANRDPALEANIPEMAFQYPPTSLLTPYYAMPYAQFDTSYIADTHSVFIKNNFIQATTDFIDFYTATLVNTNTQLDNYAGPSLDIGPNLSFDETYSAFDIPTNVDADTVIVSVDYSFRVSAEDTLNEVSTRNNRIIKNQVFANFFAYDDGSAEQAFGLKPQSNDALYGRTMVRYFAEQPDTLQAVSVVFEEFVEELAIPTNENFSILVWKSVESDSTEEEILFQRDFINLDNLPIGDTLETVFNRTFIPIEQAFIISGEEHLIIEGEFFVGVGIQPNNILSIGSDVNTDGSEFQYINFGNGWTPTQFSGSVMINPVMGKTLPDEYVVVSVNDNVIQQLEYNIFPNPVSHVLTIESKLERGYLEVMDILGNVISTKSWNGNTQMNVQDWTAGVYIIKLSSHDRQTSAIRKVIKQ